MGHREHRLRGPASVRCAVLTVSDTRDESNDSSGALILRSLRRAGHTVADYRILKDEPRVIASHVRRLARAAGCRAVLVTGGTGIARRDSTYEAIEGLLEKRIEGFGEIFRAESFRSIGSAAMLSRAVAGTYRGLMVFSMPGSVGAVRLALALILPELGHVAGLLADGPHEERHAARRSRR